MESASAIWGALFVFGGLQVTDLSVGDQRLAGIHRKSNDKKFFCYFSGFLEGVAASGRLEEGEVEPLIQQCAEFSANLDDPDAQDFLADFESDLLEFDSILDCIEFRSEKIDANCNKSASNRFLGLCAGIACDGRIYLGEVESILEFAQSRPEILSDTHVRTVVDLCRDAIDDGIVTDEESEGICSAIASLVGDAYCDTGLSSLGGVPDFESVSLSGDISALVGAHVVLTGNFSIKPRRKIEERLIEVGCDIGKSPTKETRFVIVAAEASRDWVQTHKGNKIIKALEYRSKYGNPAFLQEVDVLRTIGL